MTAEAQHKIDDGEYGLVVPASTTFASGEVRQLPDGRAGVVSSLRALTAGDKASLATKGGKLVVKAAGTSWLRGVLIYFDRANNNFTPVPGSDRFPAGCALADAAPADTEGWLDLNARPQYLVELGRDPFDSVAVANGAMTVLSGMMRLAFTTAAEAQKADLLSKSSIPAGTPFIVVGRAAIYNVGDDAALDFNIGIANDTDSDNADEITESVFLHVDGNALSINAESDDGTTEVAATDTTIDAVDDTFFDFWIDARDESDVKLYINGVRVCDGTTGTDQTFDVSDAAGPWKLLAHLEKTSNDTPGDVRIAQLAALVSDPV